MTLMEFFHHHLEKEWERKLKINLPSALRILRVEVPSPKGIDSAAQCLFFLGDKPALLADLRSPGPAPNQSAASYNPLHRCRKSSADLTRDSTATAGSTRASSVIFPQETETLMNTARSGAAKLVAAL
nr:hypothetical protein [Mesorhizobium loti]